MLQVTNLQISLCTWQSDTVEKKQQKIPAAIECVSICRLLLISDLSLLTSKLLICGDESPNLIITYCVNTDQSLHSHLSRTGSYNRVSSSYLTGKYKNKIL